MGATLSDGTFSGLTTKTRSYFLSVPPGKGVPRHVGWNSGPWTLRLGYRQGYTREELEAIPDGDWELSGWGGKVTLSVRTIRPSS